MCTPDATGTSAATDTCTVAGIVTAADGSISIARISIAPTYPPSDAHPLPEPLALRARALRTVAGVFHLIHMMSKFGSKLTYANVTSTLCLFMLLGGSAYAAATITGKNIKNGSVTGKDVKNRSLTKKDFRGSVRGRQGVPGQTGSPRGSAALSASPRIAQSPRIQASPSR